MCAGLRNSRRRSGGGRGLFRRKDAREIAPQKEKNEQDANRQKNEEKRIGAFGRGCTHGKTDSGLFSG